MKRACLYVPDPCPLPTPGVKSCPTAGESEKLALFLRLQDGTSWKYGDKRKTRGVKGERSSWKSSKSSQAVITE